MDAPLRTTLALPLAALLALAAGCGSERRPPNVVLITLDTVRADHLSCYGYERPTTPRLDALAAAATRYERCWSTAPWTVPSHASLFTGLHPHEHGAHTVPVDPRRGDNVRPLAPERVTLAEVLAEEGYRTAGFVANAIYLDRRMRLDQGFDTWDVRRERAAGVNERVFRWLDERGDGDAPFFLFVNYLDAHRPYDVAPAEGEAPYPAAQDPFETLDALIERVMVRGEAPGELGALVVEQYDRALRNLDRELGRLFDGLRARGLFDDALVVVTSDHGEYFGEHGLVEHSKDVYDAALAVPLIVKRPRQRRGETVARPASLVDLPRLVLAELPAELERRHAGTFRYALGEHPLLAQNYYSRTRDLRNPAYGARFRRVRSALIADGRKLIRSSDGGRELYALDEDPGELRDLALEDPETAARLAATLEALLARGRAGEGEEAAPVDARLLRELEALGYAPSADPEAPSDDGE